MSNDNFKRHVGKGNIFNDRRTLETMLTLRMQGVGPSQLARRFGVDHSTIIYHTKKNGVYAAIQKGITLSGFVIEYPKPKAPVVRKTELQMERFDEYGSRINQGKDYADYLIEREKKQWEYLLAGGRNKKKE